MAAFTADMDGSRVAVVNSLARRDPVVREEAVRFLAAAGVDAESIHEALNGIRR
ncbi:hypothetical protein [Streptomyces sp. bgisy153]|uniref:hypothetical protein n=1 Tax=Streptomyces sp. bgisy153 TaxID=3413793 RepID=UPI003D714828